MFKRWLLPFTLVLSVCLPFLMSGCISSLFKEPAPTFSKEINYTAPAKPFIALNKSAYPSWKNPETKNIIILTSDCSDPNLNLKSAHAIIATSIESASVIEEKEESFLGKSSVYKKTNGFVDEQPLQIFSKSFRNKDCYYVTALSGSPQKVRQDLDLWTKFNNQIQLNP